MVPDQAKGWEIETLATARPVETDRADKAVSVLLAHIVSTKCSGEIITDSDMDYPRDWRKLGGKSTSVGHQESGRTIALHSLAVSPKLQGCGLGITIMKAYLQQMNNSGLADRVSLLCQDVCLLSAIHAYSGASWRTLTSVCSTWFHTMNDLGLLMWGGVRPSLAVVGGITW